MLAQPGRKGLLATVGEQVDRQVTLQIDEDRAHVPSVPKRPVVDAQDTGCWMLLGSVATQEPQKRIGTHCYPRGNGVSCPCLAAKGKAQLDELLTEPIGAPCIGLNHC